MWAALIEARTRREAAKQAQINQIIQGVGATAAAGYGAYKDTQSSGG